MPKASAKKEKNTGEKTAKPVKKPDPQIYQFIDFFVKTGQRIRG